jgi:hypothetical protein
MGPSPSRDGDLGPFHHDPVDMHRDELRIVDGGYSGGSTERPALQRLLADIQDGRIDIVVVYKVDRLKFARRLRQAGRVVRRPWRFLRVRDPAVSE